MGLFSAISLILRILEFPVLPAFPFLKMDASDLPALIATFIFGPLSGIIIEIFKNVMILFVQGSQTGGVGELANFIVGAVFVGIAGIIYKRKRNLKYTIISLITASICMTVTAIFANIYILLPLYHMPLSTNYIVSAVIPFNIIKSVGISVITLLVYKRIAVFIKPKTINSDS
jgi:LPXTG-motif cell wall-anchored protein